MVFRRCRALILFAASVLVASVAFVGVGVVTAGSASAEAQITICLYNSSSYCVDVKDSVNKPNEPVWLYQPSAGAHDYKWYEEQVPCNDFSCLCPDGSCVEFEDAQDTSLCFGINNSLNGIALLGCELGYGGTARAAWTQEGNYFVNVDEGARAGYLAVDSPLTNGDPLYPEGYHGPGGSWWEQWGIH